MSVVIDDRQHLFLHLPFCGKGLRNHTEVTTVGCQNVVFGRILHGRKVGDVLMLESGISHLEWIEVRHHERDFQGFTYKNLRQHRDKVRLAAPDHALILI